jgi:hypothetical protein
MKNNIMSSLAILLKGSLANSILGTNGGYNYQGQTLYGQAIKCNTIIYNYI